MKDAIRAKKKAKKKWETSGRQDDRDICRQTNKEAKKEVSLLGGADIRLGDRASVDEKHEIDR